jgi:hypothetical protein
MAAMTRVADSSRDGSLPRTFVDQIDKFLRVAGHTRAYRIHLGSGNILMEPNDQYLCIVPDRRTDDRGNQIFLPFDGDRTLSPILGKALILAYDTKITDPTIVSQIRSR